MKQVFVEAIGSKVSSIGFGCASLGSRIGARQGIETLERAYEAGVTWYDVAPSYGDGMAESIWGEFASRKRDRVCVCTKVGMRPPNTPTAMRLLKPLSRMAIAVVPALKQYASRVRPTPFKVPLSAELIRSSVEESLGRLRTDYVDVLALHRATAEELVREDIIRAVERVVQDGKARAISVAGDLEAGMTALKESLPYRLVQIANTPLKPNLAKLKARAHRHRTFVTHGTFSGLDRIVAKFNTRKEILAALGDLGYRGSPNEVAIAFLADYAFATNSAGVTLVSMFKKEHLDFNLRRLKSDPTPEHLNAVAAALDMGVTDRSTGEPPGFSNDSFQNR
ncbi:aldo/keto reductase [Mesorhizobium japonicum]|uniref:Aldo/keto reductase homolog n=1 Tax=Mesorhizobium japonicum (strain LMG 29417 / CECT 9101 / MAFF 303099) TaxID=266835 RepID=Q98NV8_RHILO|nr:aldo/keto reductase [Mesorhizobium japonicum]BAB54897.1 aldo/keto reductase homolog [Mesorhizobium japonicum MAFF 303099]